MPGISLFNSHSATWALTVASNIYFDPVNFPT